MYQYLKMKDPSENSTCSREREEVSSVECYSDIPQYALSNSKTTQGESCCSVKGTVSCQDSPSGTTLKPSTENLGGEESMLLQEAFPVPTSVVPGREQESTESNLDSGERWRELLVKYDPITSSWKTHQCLWEEDLAESSVILPKWGMMRNGVCWERITSNSNIGGIEYGS